jgi:hypothetical protein
MKRFLILTTLLAANFAHAETCSLAPDGKESARGTNEEQSWRTLHKINNCLSRK